METKLAIFNGKGIRRTLHNNEWWFVITDVVSALTDSVNSSDYIKKMRSRDKELSKGWGQIVTPLSIETSGGKQKLNCANTEGLFRIIQSIPRRCLRRCRQDWCAHPHPGWRSRLFNAGKVGRS